MNRKNQSILLLFLFFIPIGVIFIHYFYLRPSITEAYHETPDPFIKLITDTFYPRFSIEKKRFDLTFFLDKSDQVIYRFTFLYYLIFLLSYLTPKKASFQAKMHTLFYTKTNSKNVTILRVIFFSYLLYIGYHLCHDLLFMQPLKSFYKPILWLNILNIPFPNYISVILLGSIWCSFILLTIFNVRPVVFSAASFALFLLFQCWEFSFEKIDHGYVTFTYAFMLIPFLLEEQKNNNQPFNSWSLSLIKISIAMVYFLSSLEKIFISKLSWLDPENLKAYLYFHETDLSKIIVQHDFLCILISSATLLLQLSFILIIFLPTYKWIWIVGGILFHTGTLLVMNIGHPLNPWIVVYIFFFDWSKVYDFFLDGFKKRMTFSN